MVTLSSYENTQTLTETKRIALVGNPNTGKTTLFNQLTGLNQKVGNYPGVTVERKTGFVEMDSTELEIVDLPGAYSLSARSPDEMVVTDVLLNRQEGEAPIDLIVAIVDASNLYRHFYLLSQLFELGKPVIVALNMIDLAQSRELKIDAEGLSRFLGIPIIPMCANKRQGIDDLFVSIRETLNHDGAVPVEKPSFQNNLQPAVNGLSAWIESQARDHVPHFELFRAFVDEKGAAEKRLVQKYGPTFFNQLQELRRNVSGSFSLTAIEAKTRYDWIAHVLKDYVTRPEKPVGVLSDKIDRILLHKVYGTIIFFLLMALMFQSIFSWAAPIMDAIESLFIAAGNTVMSVMPEGTLRSLIVDGVIAGVGAVVIFLPQIAILFFFIAILEDCGYMPRAAALMDRLLHRFGLSGKSFIPMLSSFACAVPGIMAARTISDRQNRILTILISPLMSCSARLPVYLIFIAAFVPNRSLLLPWINLQGIVLLSMYLLGVVVALAMAWLFRKTLLRKENTHFILELPTYKLPLPSSVGFYVFNRIKHFVLRAGTIILFVSVIIWALAYYPHPESISNKYENLRRQAGLELKNDTIHLLASIDPQNYNPLMDLDDFLSTVKNDSLGKAVSEEKLSEFQEQFRDYQKTIQEIRIAENGEYARQSILGSMGRFIEPVVEPLGWDWRIGMATIASFPAREFIVAAMATILNVGTEADETSVSLKEALKKATREDGTPLFNLPVALSIMVFFALCCQCAATLAIIRRETNSWKWPVLTFTYMTILAYFGAFAAYRIGLFFS